MEESEYLIIIGAMKSGTTSLYKYISSHKKICPCSEKEPEFFFENQSHGSSVDKYEDLWSCGRKYKYKIEASTGYTKYPFEKRVPKRMKKYGISPKMIYIVRNPIERIKSQHKFEKIYFNREKESFIDPKLIELSKYNRQLQVFIDVFRNKDKFLVLDFEELKERPSDLLDRCASFLGIENTFGIEEQQAANRTPRRKLDLWLSRMGKLKNVIGRRLPQRVRRGLKRSVRWITPEVEGAEMGPAEREKIREELRPDIERFSRNFQFDVSKWGF